MVAKAEIVSGICGFTAAVEARMEGRHCVLGIDSDCDAIQRLSQELTEVDPFKEITFRGEGPRILQVGAKHCYHPACPVPVGIIKAVEVEAGLALPAEATIRFSSPGAE
jgi:thioredoxin reductase